MENFQQYTSFIITPLRTSNALIMQRTLLLVFCTILLNLHAAAQVKIGATGLPNNAAVLELESNSKGFLLPRMATADMQNITNPPKGLVIFNNTDDRIYVRTDTGWAKMSVMNNYAFSAVLTNNSVIPNYSYTSLAPFSERYDYGGNFDALTGEFKTPESGVYHFEIAVVVPPQTANVYYGVRTFINGAYSGQRGIIQPSFTAPFDASVIFAFDVRLLAGENYSFQFLQRTGGNITLATGSIQATSFSGYRVY